MISKSDKYTLKCLNNVRNFINKEVDDIIPNKYLEKLDQYDTKLSSNAIVIESYTALLEHDKLCPFKLNNLIKVLLLCNDSVEVNGNLGETISNIYMDVLITTFLLSLSYDNIDFDSLEIFINIVSKKFVNNFNPVYKFPMASKFFNIEYPLMYVINLLTNKNQDGGKGKGKGNGKGKGKGKGKDNGKEQQGGESDSESDEEQQGGESDSESNSDSDSESDKEQQGGESDKEQQGGESDSDSDSESDKEQQGGESEIKPEESYRKKLSMKRNKKKQQGGNDNTEINIDNKKIESRCLSGGYMKMPIFIKLKHNLLNKLKDSLETTKKNDVNNLIDFLKFTN